MSYLMLTGPIWLDNVDCGVGVEALEDCSLSPWGQHDCDNVSDVGVLCEPSESSQRF